MCEDALYVLYILYYYTDYVYGPHFTPTMSP